MKKKNKQQRQILGELENNPLIERACKKVGVARSTFYRWCGSDFKFKDKAEAAIESGRGKMNDFAESKLLEAISLGNMQAVRYWLDNNSKRYAPVSAAELKRLRMVENIVYELLDRAAAGNDHLALQIITRLRNEVMQQTEDKKDKTRL